MLASQALLSCSCLEHALSYRSRNASLSSLTLRPAVAAALFVIQMKGISAFSPNAKTHPEFADALVRAKRNGVHIWAYDCLVTEDSMQIHQPVKVILPQGHSA